LPVKHLYYFVSGPIQLRNALLHFLYVVEVMNFQNIG
jgi:hypothetical protein